MSIYSKNFLEKMVFDLKILLIQLVIVIDSKHLFLVIG